ncbi:vWA domain-containing protein [Paenisporosarcina antarctica]|uniref:VWA domain-containing protein n=1 Tax=Paenisporosarcina antarctica TaxID=417367 RepID=A0A4P6ZZE7_9BACL|nr:vWA domain-containing protein [Paenisporosarcina antarctica]QBP41951.1 VWA domain-containing protein [Paenisporosarcina antarctica]
MNAKSTELVFILDKSGSMAGLESDTIGGFNALITKQKKEQGDARVTTILFNDGYELLHDRISIKGIAPITEKEYEVGGMTALLDAIGSTIQKIGNAQKRTSEEERAGKVMFVITTDGYENASCEYNYKKIRSMIAHQKKNYKWEFVFLGANIDAVATAEKFGIDEEFAVKYHADTEGTQLNYQVLNEAVSSFRTGKKLDRSWKIDIEADYEQRK